MNNLDLQIQTTASDGKHSPTECVQMAKANGVHTIAITDHDTVAGVAEALRVGKELGVRVIPGIEMSVAEHGMHLLGLGIDIKNETLLAALKKFAEGRIWGAQQMTENLKKAGFVVEWEDVMREATGAVVARPHIAAAVMKRPENRGKLGGIERKGDFIERFLSNTSPSYVHRTQIGAGDAIALMHNTGGVIFWSHPPIPDFVGQCGELEQFLQELILLGLDGMELLNPAHGEDDVRCIEALVARYKLLASAGSDFHERYNPTGETWPRSASTVGDYPTYGRSTEGMVKALDGAVTLRRSAGAL